MFVSKTPFGGKQPSEFHQNNSIRNNFLHADGKEVRRFFDFLPLCSALHSLDYGQLADSCDSPERNQGNVNRRNIFTSVAQDQEKLTLISIFLSFNLVMNEPVRKSYFDLIKANMAAAKRNQFITRLVYFGMYHGTEEYLRKKFEVVIKHLRSEYPESRVTGMLLIYPLYFVHVIEAPDELIFRHLTAIFGNEEMKINLGRVLPLPLYHHVHECFFSRWIKLFTKPPELLDKLEGTGTPEIQKQLRNCFLKVYSLCEHISSHDDGRRGSVDEVLKSLSDENDQRHLPESTLLEFLLKSKSPILRDIREYVEMAKIVPHIKLYNEIIWPPVCDFMPQEVFVEHASRRDLMLRRLSSKRQSY